MMGVILLIVGAVISFIPFVCLAGIPMAIIGLVLLLVGVIQEGPRPAYGAYGYQAQQYQYSQYPQSAPYPGMQPIPQQPEASPPPAQPAQPAQTATPNCPRCGRPLTYVYQYQRWFCPAENVYPWG